MSPSQRSFPFDVFAASGFPAPLGELIEQVRPVSMLPPHPWGQWVYGRVFTARCASLRGDILEAGVGMGGMSFFLALLVRQLGQERQVLSVDSFEGLPAPDARKDNPYFAQGLYGPQTPQSDPLAELFAGGDDAALECFRMRAVEFGVEDHVRPVQGFFEDVFPELEADRSFCFVHIDGDLFESVYCALDQLWDRVVGGGVIAIDDFFHPGQGPLRAASEFFNERGLTPVYHVCFPYSVFLIKEDWGRPSRCVDGNAYSLEWLRRDRLLQQALERSRKPSRKDRRARDNCALLLETLSSPAYPGEIYDYWRSLEQFWASIDIRPEDWAAA